jgi:hypothetical protein
VVQAAEEMAGHRLDFAVVQRDGGNASAKPLQRGRDWCAGEDPQESGEAGMEGRHGNNPRSGRGALGRKYLAADATTVQLATS